jgi:hypothetical protein
MPTDQETDPLGQVSTDSRRWIQSKLRKCRFVDWDRFTVAYEPDWPGPVVCVYGWIEREQDHRYGFEYLQILTGVGAVVLVFALSVGAKGLHRILMGDNNGE